MSRPGVHGVAEEGIGVDGQTRSLRLPALRTFRRSRGLTQRDLAAMAKVTQGTVYRLENSRGGAYLSTVKKLSTALSVSPADLMSESPPVAEVAPRTAEQENDNRLPEELGLAPDLSSLPRETLELIRRGGSEEHRSRSETRLKACAEMLLAGYGTDEIWTVLTDPTNGISREFFEEDGEEAEASLDRIISEAWEAAKMRE